MPVNIDKFGRIDGSRTTVYHVMDYYTENDPVDYIVKCLPLTVEQVQAAIAWIEANRAEVDLEYRKMLEREARGNPPEVQAKLEQNAKKFRQMIEEFRLAQNHR